MCFVQNHVIIRGCPFLGTTPGLRSLRQPEGSAIRSPFIVRLVLPSGLVHTVRPSFLPHRTIPLEPHPPHPIHYAALFKRRRWIGQGPSFVTMGQQTPITIPSPASAFPSPSRARALYPPRPPSQPQQRSQPPSPHPSLSSPSSSPSSPPISPYQSAYSRSKNSSS